MGKLTHCSRHEQRRTEVHAFACTFCQVFAGRIAAAAIRLHGFDALASTSSNLLRLGATIQCVIYLSSFAMCPYGLCIHKRVIFRLCPTSRTLFCATRTRVCLTRIFLSIVRTCAPLSFAWIPHFDPESHRLLHFNRPPILHAPFSGFAGAVRTRIRLMLFLKLAIHYLQTIAK